MNALTDLLRHPEARALGWTLLHFLWQGALLAVVFALARAALRHRGAGARYLAGCGVLLGMAVAVLATWTQVPRGDGPTAPGLRLPAVPSLLPPRPWTVTPGSSPHATPWGDVLDHFAEATLPWLTAAWLAGVTVLSLRLLGGWWQVRALRRAPGVPLEGRLGLRLCALQARLRVNRPVRVLQSAVVQVPTVVGWFRPAILLPASTLTGLSPHQLDFILAHELAHIRRGDSWVNLLQVTLETVLFYHPAVWWVSRCVREEREHCCDDLALAACGDGLAGARALAALEELRQTPPQLALAATGGSLLGRVKRLLGLPGEDADWRRPLGSTLVGLGLILMLAGFVAFGRPSRYEARARIAIQPPGTAVGPGGESHDPYHLTTETARLRSDDVLLPVVRQLGLDTRWGPGGQRLSPDAAVEELRARLAIVPVRNTRLFELVVSSAVPAEARDVANAIAESYRDRRLEEHRRRAGSGVRAMEKSLAEQDARIAALKHRLGESAKPPGDAEEGTGSRADGPGGRSNLATLYAQVQSQLLIHEGEREALRGLEPADLVHAVTTLLAGEVMLPQLQLNLAEAEQTLARLRVDYASDHPEVREGEALCLTIERQIHERLQGILAGLDNRIAVEKAQQESLLEQLTAERQNLAAEVQRQAESSGLARDLETEQRIRDSIALRWMQEKLDAETPEKAPVELVDVAAMPVRPVRSGPAAGGALFGSGVLSMLVGLVLRIPRRTGTAGTRGS